MTSEKINDLEATTQEKSNYRFTFQPFKKRIKALVNDITIADSHNIMVMQETRLPEVYYFPRKDVRMDLMQKQHAQTYCPFKGNASYWTLKTKDKSIENIMWSYEAPYENAIEIKDYVAFYSEKIDGWYEDDIKLSDAKQSNERATIKNHSNPLLYWILHDAPEIKDPVTLTEKLINELLRSGIPLWRLVVVIPTLHPQLAAVAYRWWAKTDEVEYREVSYEMLQTPGYLNSPLVPIYEGIGGIRRRLDIKDPMLDYGILKELYDEGATDYVAMPLAFTNGQINALTLASNRPGGFSTTDLGYLYEILAVLGRLYEVHSARKTTSTLLETYLGRHAGERVMDGLIKRGDGESIDAVIWFCDLRDSMKLAQSMSVEEFLTTLNEFFDCLALPVMKNGGQVLRFIGDAALAIFPISNQDQLNNGQACTPAQIRDKALNAANEAQNNIIDVNKKRLEENKIALQFGLGLHVGEVTFGNIGTQKRLEYTVIGDAANHAARIESMCKILKQPILLSQDFAQHYPKRFKSLGHHKIRGIVNDQELFTIKS